MTTAQTPMEYAKGMKAPRFVGQELAGGRIDLDTKAQALAERQGMFPMEQEAARLANIGTQAEQERAGELHQRQMAYTPQQERGLDALDSEIAAAQQMQPPAGLSVQQLQAWVNDHRAYVDDLRQQRWQMLQGGTTGGAPAMPTISNEGQVQMPPRMSTQTGPPRLPATPATPIPYPQVTVEPAQANTMLEDFATDKMNPNPESVQALSSFVGLLTQVQQARPDQWPALRAALLMQPNVQAALSRWSEDTMGSWMLSTSEGNARRKEIRQLQARLRQLLGV